MKDLISIIVPVYNVEKYIEKCVNSIAAQSYDNLEIILVDDGTPDKSGDICDELAVRDSRIKVIHKANGGLSDARNAGRAAANGEYIIFIDSDDYINKYMIESMHEQMVKNNADIVICDIEEVCEGNTETLPCDVRQDESISVLTRDEAQNIYFDDAKKRIVFTVAWNKLYKKSFFDEIEFPKGKIHEDEFTSFRLQYKADKIILMNAKYYYYIRRESSIMGTFNEKRLHLLQAYIERLDFYIEHEEYALCKKMIMLYMHMAAQLVAWMKDAGCYKKEMIRKYQQYLGNRYEKLKGKLSFTLKNRLEIWLFRTNMRLYYFLWKSIR